MRYPVYKMYIYVMRIMCIFIMRPWYLYSSCYKIRAPYTRHIVSQPYACNSLVVIIIVIIIPRVITFAICKIYGENVRLTSSIKCRSRKNGNGFRTAWKNIVNECAARNGYDLMGNAIGTRLIINITIIIKECGSYCYKDIT